MTELLLIRHGQTEWNAGEIFRGHADIDLDETGMIQARLLAEYLKKTKINAIYSSPLMRALKTASGIAESHGLEIGIEPGLIDFDYGEWQGMPQNDVKKIYKDLYRNWLETPASVRMPGGEKLDDVAARSRAVINMVIRKHTGTVALVSHRVIIKVLVCMLLGLDNSHFWNIRLDNCGITSFTFENNSWIITGHNDVSFLRDIAFEKLSDF